MKFIVAVALLALSTSAYAGIGLGPVVDVASSYSPVGSWGPAVVNSWGAPLVHSHGPWGNPWNAGWAPAAAPWGVSPWAAAPWGAPHITLSQGHGHVAAPVHAAPLVAAHGHEAKYVASNRGSVHVAPLPGHTQSVTSTNVEPAPGTW